MKTNLPTVIYKLKETCAWSVGSACEYSYVEVTIVDDPAADCERKQVLELPTTEALHLCASMASPTVLDAILERNNFGTYAPFAGCAFPAMAQLIAKRVGHFPQAERIDLVVNMRTGTFEVYDNDLSLCGHLFHPDPVVAPAVPAEWKAMVKSELLKFCSNTARANAWLDLAPMNVYMRSCAIHSSSGYRARCVDVANVQIADNNLRGLGYFSTFLSILESLIRERSINDGCLYVFNVMEPRLALFLAKRGYLATGSVPVSYYAFFK